VKVEGIWWGVLENDDRREKDHTGLQNHRGEKEENE
jgi:hypothetical protein